CCRTLRVLRCPEPMRAIGVGPIASTSNARTADDGNDEHERGDGLRRSHPFHSRNAQRLVSGSSTSPPVSRSRQRPPRRSTSAIHGLPPRSHCTTHCVPSRGACAATTSCAAHTATAAHRHFTAHARYGRCM